MDKMINKLIEEYNRNSALSYLKEMIKIPSTSNEEKDLARYVGGKLEQLGIKVTWQKLQENSENVFAIIKGINHGPKIMLTGHLDTIAPLDGWSTDPFEPVEKGDRVHGLGAADMKAGIATILSIAEIIIKNKLNLKGDLILAFIADEEGHSKGIKELLNMGIKTDVAFMVEPHFDKAVIGAAGKMLIKGKVNGKACHAANPEEGINAIEETAKFIGNLENIKTPHHDKIKAQPYVTLNIDGGYKSYSITVPDFCSFTLNKHTVPGETKEVVLRQLTNLKNNLNLKADFSFEIGEPFYPSYIIDENLEYLKTLRKIYENVTGNELGIDYSNGVSDSNCLVGIGKIPTINFGPAGGPIHAPNEWVSKKQFFTSIEIYLRLISNYLVTP